MDDFDIESHMLATIYGNCIGDAIGLLTEFMVKSEAEKYYQKHVKSGLRYEQKVGDFHRSRWAAGDWTDDSDQLILILDSLLEKRKIDYVDYGHKLIHWSYHGFEELGDLGGNGLGATTHHVLSHASFDKNPHEAAKDIWERTGCFVAPNGAVMRTAILGIYQYQSLEDVKKNTLQICKVSHADPRCQASCVAVTCAIALMLQRNHVKNGQFDVEAIIAESYQHAMEVFDSKHKDAYKKQCHELKQFMSVKKLKDLHLDEHGKIGYTYKTLGAGFWALRQQSFQDSLTKITMEAGDADTNGAVAGALLGCKLGIRGLPDKWLEELKHKDWLDQRLYRFFKFSFPEMEIKHLKPSASTAAENHPQQQSTQSDREALGQTQTADVTANVASQENIPFIDEQK